MTHWVLKTIAVMVKWLTRIYNFQWLPDATELQNAGKLLGMSSMELAHLTQPSGLGASRPSHDVRYSLTATSPRYFPSVSNFLWWLKFCSSYFHWLETHSLTLHIGKAHSGFKTQLKYHFARRVLSSPYRLNEPPSPWVSVILYLGECFHIHIKCSELSYVMVLSCDYFLTHIGSLPVSKPRLWVSWRKESYNFGPYQRTWPIGNECSMTEFTTNIQSKRWWAQRKR